MNYQSECCLYYYEEHHSDRSVLHFAGEVRARQGRYGAMDIVKMPVGAGSGFIWDTKGHIVRHRATH